MTTFKQFLDEEKFDTALELVQHIVDNYNRACGKNWKAEEVSVKHFPMKSAKPNDCYNNAYRYLLRENDNAKYVLGFVMVHNVPIEHAWVRDGEQYLDPTLTSGEYIKVAEFDEEQILKFVVKNHHAPSLYDTMKF